MPDRPQRHLPLSKRDVVELCATDDRLPTGDRAAFRDFCRILASVFHFEFHERLERLKRCHAPFDPDSDAVRLPELAPPDREKAAIGLRSGLEELLRAANYDEVPRSALADSLHGESLFRVRLAVDFDDFEEIVLFRRGAEERSETIRTLFGLRRREVRFVNFARVVLLARFRPPQYFEDQGRRDLGFTPGTTVIKLFRNIPAQDLEMVFPNTAVRMKPIDKLLIGVPAAVGGLLLVATKLLGTLILVGALFAFWLGLRDEPVRLDQTALVALAAGLLTFGGFVLRQFNRFKSRKIRFLKALTENLYFKTLDNNAGVFHRLVDDAEEEECKEAILAYWFLLTATAPLSATELDREVESWLRDRTGIDIDFEVRDAAGKLERLGLAAHIGEALRVPSLTAARTRLDEIWDGYFRFAPD
ncbi:MAG: DUF3754 domain-containing protein [Planctomycetes bacterium]|nr:DUF3754 domain-containing protein [Planctomycetota bacterium]